MKKKIIASVLISVGILLTGCANKQVSSSSDQPKTDINKQIVKEQDNSATKKTDVKDEAKKQPSSNQSEKSYYGQWVVKEAIGYAEMANYDKSSVKIVIGKTLTFSKEMATFFKDEPNEKNIDNIFKNPVYKELKVDANVAFEDFHVPGDKAELESEEIMKVAVYDSKNTYGTSLFIKDNNTLFLCQGGTIFLLERKITK